MNNDSVSILLADDHTVVREGTAMLLKNNFSKVNIHKSCDLEESIAILKKETIDLVVLDIKMPGGYSPDMISKVRAAQKDVKILIFSVLEEKYHGVRYIQAGANGYLNKTAEEPTIIKAIRKILTTGQYAGESIKDLMIGKLFGEETQNLFDILSKQENEVARFLIDGKTSSDIANQMNIHVSTVSTYKKRIFKKLEIDSVVGLVEMFRDYV